MKLCVDFTNSHVFSVVLANEKNIIVEVVYNTSMFYGSRFFVEGVEKCLEIAQKRFSDIHEIVIARGPGSFTALRALISYVKGIAVARDVKIHSFLSFDWMALFVKEKVYLSHETLQESHNAHVHRGKVLLTLFSGAKDFFYSAEYDLEEVKILSLYIRRKDEIERLREAYTVFDCDHFVEFELGAKYLCRLSSVKQGEVFTRENLSKLSPEYVFKPDFRKSFGMIIPAQKSQTG